METTGWLERQAKANLSERVYEQLRSDIVHGVLRPRQPIIEAEEAHRLQVSRTPIRESLHRLASDGLIVLRNRRWQVYEHSPSEIRELYEIRACQESFAARLACERADENQLQAIGAARVLATRLSDPAERVENNNTFHDVINRTAGNDRLYVLIQRSRLYHFNVRTAALYTDDELGASSAEHNQITDAILRREGDKAEQLVRAHVQGALEVTLRAVAQTVIGHQRRAATLALSDAQGTKREEHADE